MKQSLQLTYKFWVSLTLVIIASVIAVYIRNGQAGLNLFIQQWPLSNLAVTLEATAFTWLCVGAILYLLINERVNSGNVWLITGFFIIIILYLGILRERFRYGDYAYYIEAATALLNHQPLPDTYLYLPLWATLLQFIVPLGDQGVLAILWPLNIIALGAFYLLLIRVLEQYNFSKNFAVSVTVLFMLINTPLHRTLGYVQVNLLVMDLIFISIFTYSKNAFLSALTLALAIHLKTSPAVLVLAFLLEFNWRWLFWFTVSFILIALIPVAINGISPYFDYLHNIAILTQIPDTNFHDTSFDSFLRFLDPFFGINILWTRVMIYTAKAALLLGIVLVMIKNIRSKSFLGDGSKMMNAMPSLFVIMTLASPIVWDHHGIFTALSFLLLLKRIDAPNLWAWFGFAYLLEFILPSFDFFPWSYGRLLAPIIALWLMWKTANAVQPSQFFTRANQMLAKIAG